MTQRNRARGFVAVGLLAISAAGCVSDRGAVPDSLPAPELIAPTPTVQNPGEVKYYPSDEPLKLGFEHFDRGNYGTAERYFRDAVEKAPRDATAWGGLAATYDRLARFDLADRAYRSAIGFTGETTQLLNNQGYSYMLRGDLANARRTFLQAYERESNNPLIINNLKLLDSSQRLIRRAPDPHGVAPD
jgi:Flp pilus assembly protein TadD